MDKEEVQELFISGKYKTMCVGVVTNILKKYISNTPLYINEIKDFLLQNDKDLYKKYAECFKNNPGVELAFGISYTTKDVVYDDIHIKEFVTYKPVYDIRKQESHKKRKKVNKKDIRTKYKERKMMKEENDKKIEDIKMKIKKSY